MMKSIWGYLKQQSIMAWKRWWTIFGYCLAIFIIATIVLLIAG